MEEKIENLLIEIEKEENNHSEHEHSHDSESPHYHEHSHNHNHSHTHTKAVINRLARAIGHLESIKKMVEDGRECTEVLIQLSAVRSAINNTGKVVLKDHIEHCIVEAVETNNTKKIEELNKAIEQFMK